MEEASRRTRWAHQHTHIHTQLLMQTHGTLWSGAEPHTGPLRAPIMRREEEGVQAVWWGGQKKKISPSHHRSQQAGVGEQALLTPSVLSPHLRACRGASVPWEAVHLGQLSLLRHSATSVVHLGSTLPPEEPHPRKGCPGPPLHLFLCSGKPTPLV